jgi:hypothetical protein
LLRNRIIAGEVPDPELYKRVVTWPELWDDQEIYETYKEEMYDKEVHREKAKEHRLLNTVRWAAKSPRYAFEEIEAGRLEENGRGAPDAEEDNEGDVEVPEDLTEVRDGAEAILDEGGEDASGLEDEDETEDEDDADEEGAGVGDEEDGMFEEGSDSDGSEDDRPARPFGGLYR